MRLFPKRFPPLPPGYRDYWVKLHVFMRSGAYGWEGNDDPPNAYYQIFGLRCAEGEYRRLLQHEVNEGEVDWDGSEIVARNSWSLPWKMRLLFNPVEREGIWYRSGCVYYDRFAPGDYD